MKRSHKRTLEVKKPTLWYPFRYSRKILNPVKGSPFWAQDQNNFRNGFVSFEKYFDVIFQFFLKKFIWTFLINSTTYKYLRDFFFGNTGEGNFFKNFVYSSKNSKESSQFSSCIWFYVCEKKFIKKQGIWRLKNQKITKFENLVQNQDA